MNGTDINKPFGLPAGTPVIVTHPNNRELIEKQITQAAGFGDVGRMIAPVRYDPHIPERDVAEIWHAPAGDRFVEYGPADEHWMRPALARTGDARFGWIEHIDRGPKIYIVRVPEFSLRTAYGMGAMPGIAIGAF